MSDSLYHELILYHYKHPERFGRLTNPTKTETVFNPLCGDTLTIDIVEQDGYVNEIGWHGEGCAISQASMSLLSGKIEGESKDGILKVTREDIYELLGTRVTFLREKCALLPLVGIKRILKDND